MHMRHMAEFLRGLSLNGTTPKSLWALAPSVSSEDQGAAAASASIPSGARAAASCNNNFSPSQPSEEMQRLREMDGRLVKQDHQLRELIILKDTRVWEVLQPQTTNIRLWFVSVIITVDMSL